MDTLINIPETGRWEEVVGKLNQNIDIIQDELDKIEIGESYYKGFYLSLNDLRSTTNKYPYPPVGAYAYVNENGEFPATRYEYSDLRTWISTGLVNTPENFDIRILLESEDLEGNIKSILLD